MIREKTVFVTRGKTFDSREQAEAHRVDCVGAFFDRAPVCLHPRERLRVVEFIAQHRAELSELLDW